MNVLVNLYSTETNEINNFLSNYYNSNSINLPNNLKWEKSYDNPIEVADIIGVFIDNNNKYKINMWISLDSDLFLNITDQNSDKIIRYLFERYPY